MTATDLHESEDKLPPDVIDRHRAIRSLMEELEAVDWYDQRAAVATDAELRQVIAHNRDEEKEHAMMILEWLRRNDAKFAEMIEVYVGAEGPIVEAEEAATDEENGETVGAPDGSLGIGSLRDREAS